MKRDYWDFIDDITINDVALKNIFTKFDITFTEESKNNDTLLTHTLADGESPEDLAFFYYDDKRYYWIILLLNNIKDYFYDWLLSYEEIKDLTNRYWDDGVTYDLDTKEDLFNYLLAGNDTRREVYYLNPVYLNDFLKEIGK